MKSLFSLCLLTFVCVVSCQNVLLTKPKPVGVIYLIQLLNPSEIKGINVPFDAQQEMVLSDNSQTVTADTEEENPEENSRKKRSPQRYGGYGGRGSYGGRNYGGGRNNYNGGRRNYGGRRGYY